MNNAERLALMAQLLGGNVDTGEGQEQFIASGSAANRTVLLTPERIITRAINALASDMGLIDSAVNGFDNRFSSIIGNEEADDSEAFAIIGKNLIQAIYDLQQNREAFSKQGLSIQSIGDSISAKALQSVRISSLVSGSDGVVTITAATSHAEKGDWVRIQNVTPLSFNGDFYVEDKPNETTYIIHNPNAPTNTTAGPDLLSLNMMLMSPLVENGIGYQHIGASLAERNIPHFRIDAMTSTTLSNWLARLDTYVRPVDAEYIHILLGANDMAGNTAQTVENRFANLIDALLLRGYKLIVGTVTPQKLTSDNLESNIKILEVNMWLKTYCQQRNIPVADYHTALYDAVTGNGIAEYFDDYIHPSTKGHSAMGAVLAEVYKNIFSNNSMLPISALQNIASKTNMFDDPLITKTPVASTSPGVTGFYGAETVVTVEQGTAVASVVPRTDGFGNDVKAVAILTGAYDASRIIFTTSKTNTFTATEDCAVIPILSFMASGGEIKTEYISWKFIKNGTPERSLNMPPFGTPLTNRFVSQGEPLFLRAGDTLSNVSIRASATGVGTVTAQIGRIMVRIIPWKEYIRSFSRDISGEATKEFVITGDAETLAAAKGYADSLITETTEISPITPVTGFSPNKFLGISADGTHLVEKDAAESGSGSGIGIPVYEGTPDNPVVMSEIPSGFCGIKGNFKPNPESPNNGSVQLSPNNYAWGVIDKIINTVFFTTFYDSIYRIYKGNMTGQYNASYVNRVQADILTTSNAQTITSVKTFSVLPVSDAAPTADNQLVNKKYVDDLIAQLKES